MREILFRGKRKNNGEWIEGNLLTSVTYPNLAWINDGITFIDRRLNSASFVEVDPSTVGQYTGLIDNNGVKIFEGDIIAVEESSYKFVVKFSIDRVGFFPFACGDGCGCCEIETIYPKFQPVEVIGNIHDNPELLEGAV